MPGTPFPLEVIPSIPPRLRRLDELANNLWYSWSGPARAIFSRLHPALWRAVNRSPKAFLKRIDQKRLDAAAQDPAFLVAFNRVLSEFDTYLVELDRPPENAEAGPNQLIAYFCFEFGFHESLPIYSGGLGILAGDHGKEASDLHLPFVAIGLLFRQSYFRQIIDRDGQQQALYTDSNFDDLPITPVRGHDGSELRVQVELINRRIWVRIWHAQVGHVSLYLLDTDLEVNNQHDRDITHLLYGGDRTTRIEQELVLGVGGVRVLRELGLKPTVWHINEGHPAFMIPERIQALREKGLDFASALEAVAANTVFTTHTAVPAGHDRFDEAEVTRYFRHCFPLLEADMRELLALGHMPGSAEFNMTALAVRGSRFQNGVSRIHGRVSAAMLSALWPEIEAEDNPIGFINNGVHVPTFLAEEWHEPFDRFIGEGWSQRLADPACWCGVLQIPDLLFYSVRQSLKVPMLHLVRHAISIQYARNQGAETPLERLLRLADPGNPNVLTIGFARRFATYKRATLLFENLEWLQKIVSDPRRPVLFIFAGKAHPADQPGQALLHRVHEVARMPEFEGHILLLEDYDLHLARRLVSGVDVWLNTPVYPLEASGTSGMKAAINGAVNLSVLDGWWNEGYAGDNGWAIKPTTDVVNEAERDRIEARALYQLLQDKVIPLYYATDSAGFSPGWAAMAKRSMASIMPRFNTTRMVTEYVDKFYVPGSKKWLHFEAGGFDQARRLAAWKARVRAAWPGVTLRRFDSSPRHLRYGESLRVEVTVNLNGLAPEDVAVELLLNCTGVPDAASPAQRFLLVARSHDAGKECPYALDLIPELCGQIECRFRAYPQHDLLTHPFEMGMMRWL